MDLRWIPTALVVTACASKPISSAAMPTQSPVGSSEAGAAAKQTNREQSIAPITVALVVDQLAAWVARDRLALLPANGGFARLRREGTWYQDVRLGYAITETAPGHASLYTGKVPRDHGIVGNELWLLDHSAAIVADETTRTVTAEGERPEFGASLRALTAEVVADRFKARVPNARVYSLSIKDRGALFGGGHHPDLSLWYDVKGGQFVSSTAFTSRFPDWVVPALGHAVMQERFERVWLPLQPYAGNETRPGTVDDEPGEGDRDHYGIKFPHQPSHSSQPSWLFRASPESDKMLLELGLLAIDNTPKDAPILLAISLSANDYIGHLFGPDSWEAKDELFRLDAALGWFFSELDRRRGSEHWNAVLSADHGVVPLPEVSRIEAKAFHEEGTQGTRPREITDRVLPVTIAESVRSTAKRVLGKGDWIAAFLEPYVYVADSVKQLPTEKSQKFGRALREDLEKLPCVARVFETAALPQVCSAGNDDSLETLVCRSVQRGRGGEFYVAVKPDCFFDTGYVPGFGTSHGSSGIANRAIPLLLRAPGKVEAGKVEPQPQSFELFFRRLVELLGVK